MNNKLKKANNKLSSAVFCLRLSRGPFVMLGGRLALCNVIPSALATWQQEAEIYVQQHSGKVLCNVLRCRRKFWLSILVNLKFSSLISVKLYSKLSVVFHLIIKHKSAVLKSNMCLHLAQNVIIHNHVTNIKT